MVEIQFVCMKNVDLTMTNLIFETMEDLVLTMKIWFFHVQIQVSWFKKDYPLVI